MVKQSALTSCSFKLTFTWLHVGSIIILNQGGMAPKSYILLYHLPKVFYKYDISISKKAFYPYLQ